MTQAVSLEGVLAAAQQGRAPVAAESAGYLALAIADQLVRAPLVVDEASISLGADGSVLVTGAPTSSTVDAERAVRLLLSSMLAVAPSSTPALGAAARRSSGAGMGALVAELEGALIPVNRGAARRTLARIARETSRAGVSVRPRRRAPVAEIAPPQAARVVRAVVAEPAPEHSPAFLTPPPMPVVAPPGPLPVPVVLAPAPIEMAVVAAAPPSLPPALAHMPVVEVEIETAELPPLDEMTDPCPVALEPSDASTIALPVQTIVSPEVSEHTVPLEFGAAAPPPARYDAPCAQQIVVPPPLAESRAMPVPPVDGAVAAPTIDVDVETFTPEPAFAPEPTYVPEPTPAIDVSVGTPIDARAAQGPRPRSRVDELLDSFRHSDVLDERALSGALKRVAGLEPTPPPPAVVLTAPPAPVVLAAEHEPPPEAPRAGERSVPPPPSELPVPRAPRAPRTASALLTGLLLLGVVAIVVAWVRFPWLFTGHAPLGVPLGDSPRKRRLTAGALALDSARHARAEYGDSQVARRRRVGRWARRRGRERDDRGSSPGLRSDAGRGEADPRLRRRAEDARRHSADGHGQRRSSRPAPARGVADVHRRRAGRG